MDSGATDAAFLGSELKRARIAAGITSQDELAKRLGFERTSIAKIETGERLPSPEVAAAYGREFPALGGWSSGGRTTSAAPAVRSLGSSARSWTRSAPRPA